MEMNFLINAYYFALMGPSFLSMSSSDGQHNASKESLVYINHTLVIH